MAIKVSLISKSSLNPTNLISFAAKTCYSSDIPKFTETLNTKEQLFDTGHHTTFQHSYFTFIIETSVSSCTFGLHLTHSFYNSDQRSGRYSKMYKSPDFTEIKKHILTYYPNCPIEKVMDFIKKGREIYKDNMKKAEKIAMEFLREERREATEEYIESSANKLAQEQMRVYLSAIFPTALVHTLSLSAIVTLYKSAWSPELREITRQMRDLILREYPDFEYCFKEQRETNWTPALEGRIGILKSPEVYNIRTSHYGSLDYDFEKEKDAIDNKYFTPEKMNNSLYSMTNNVEVSLMTMGQDQRHRTLKRTTPRFTGNFYLPPICGELNLEKVTLEYLIDFIEIYKENKEVATAIAPYGIMVKYKKMGDMNAILHEQEKRLCWTAQEEIYNLSRQFYNKLMEGEDESVKEVALLFRPSCYHGKCIEGKRFCGRNLVEIKENKLLIKRRRI
ncbi:MAG: FAD-dependent thymidylate synthase [Rickettsiales bacterium]|jgi:hypothetical protein|nr:FAD-dependent thymidylate synthase [Rickettsiales bacterium]